MLQHTVDVQHYIWQQVRDTLIKWLISLLWEQTLSAEQMRGTYQLIMQQRPLVSREKTLLFSNCVLCSNDETC